MPGPKPRSTSSANGLKISSRLHNSDIPPAPESLGTTLPHAPDSVMERKEHDGVRNKSADTSPPAEFKDALGVSDHDTSVHLLAQALSATPHLDIERDLQTYQKLILTILRGIGPKDTVEGVLAVQMVAVHNAAMHFLARAVAKGNNMQVTDANVNRANKLFRTFIALTEGLNHHRGKITQALVVGNVNVADGGQAIVGPVNHPGPGKVSKDGEKEKTG